MTKTKSLVEQAKTMIGHSFDGKRIVGAGGPPKGRMPSGVYILLKGETEWRKIEESEIVDHEPPIGFGDAK